MPKSAIVRVEAIVAVDGGGGLTDGIERPLVVRRTVRRLEARRGGVSRAGGAWGAVRVGHGVSTTVEHILLLIHRRGRRGISDGQGSRAGEPELPGAGRRKSFLKCLCVNVALGWGQVTSE